LILALKKHAVHIAITSINNFLMQSKIILIGVTSLELLAFLEGRHFSSQSELLESISNCSDWLDKSRSSKKATFVLIM